MFTRAQHSANKLLTSLYLRSRWSERSCKRKIFLICCFFSDNLNQGPEWSQLYKPPQRPFIKNNNRQDFDADISGGRRPTFPVLQILGVYEDYAICGGGREKNCWVIIITTFTISALKSRLFSNSEQIPTWLVKIFQDCQKDKNLLDETLTHPLGPRGPGDPQSLSFPGKLWPATTNHNDQV